MTEIARGEIQIDLNDAEAIAGLRAVDREFDRTMRGIDGTKAEYQLSADTKRLKRDLKEADAALERSRARQEYAESKQDTKNNQKRRKQLAQKIKDEQAIQARLRKQITYQKQRLKLQEDDLAIVQSINKSLGDREKKERAIEKALDRRARKLAKEEAAQRRMAATQERAARENEKRDKAAEDRIQRMGRLQAAAEKEDQRREAARSKAAEKELADERRLVKAHSEAAAMDRRRTYEAITGSSKHEAAVGRLQKRYADFERQISKNERELGKLRTMASRPIRQKLELKQREILLEMEVIRAELTAMGKEPINQRIDLEVDQRHANQLSRALGAFSETAIRLGPITTSMAGLGRALALLGPIIVGIVGQLGALIAVTGSGLAGALGVGGAALAAFGISLGGVGLLMPSLLNDFKNLNTLQKAYHTQVLKTGVNSDKAKTKLQEFEHAMRTVPESTRRAFNALDMLKNKWKEFTDNKSIQSDFFSGLEQGLKTVNHQFDWFKNNTIGAFDALNKGWTRWMKGLRTNEADRILTNLGKAGNQSIQPLMKALGALATAFGRVSESFARHLPGLLKGFRDWSQNTADATKDSGRLNGVVDRMVDSMRSLGHFIMAAGRFLSALFAPGVDPGRKMLDSWTRGLNRTAEAMRTTKREKISEFFKQAIDTADKFWRAIKPLAQIFFEWSTIMRPFTDIAVRFFGVLADGAQTILAFKPAKVIMQGLFGWFLVAQVFQRAAAFATSLMLIKDAVVGIKAAGGLGAALKTGALSRLFNPFHGMGQPGSTPARPLFTKEVGIPGGGGGGGVVGGGGGMLNMLKGLPRFAKIGGGAAAAIGAFVLGFNELRKSADKAYESKGMQKVDEQIKQLTAQGNLKGLRDLKNEFINLRKDGWGGMDDAESHIDKAIGAVTKLQNAIVQNSIVKNFQNLARSGAKSMDAIRNTVSTNMQVIRSRLGSQSAEGKAAIAKNFKLAADAVKKRMDESGHHTREGARLIRSYMIRALEALGLNRAQAESKLDTGTINTQERTPGRAPRNAKGGLYQVGRAGAAGLDNVPMNLGGIPAVVANGEQIAVFNRHQQAKFGAVYPGGLNSFFSGPQRPHSFAGGGIVPVPGFPGESAASSVIPQILQVAKTWGLVLTDAYGSGHKSPGHTRFGTAADFAGPDAAMTAAAHALAAQGYIVGYDGTGGTQAWPGHGPSSVAGANAHLHVEFGTRGGAIQIAMPKIPNVTSEIPGGPGALVNQGLSIIHATAQETAEKIAASVMAIPMAGGGGTGKDIAAGMLAMFGWGQNQFPPLDTLWTGESGWNPSATNPSSGAYGIPQALPGNKMASAGSDWQTNPATQVRWGLGYIKSRYGSPAKALSAWMGRSPHWYGLGGIATMAKSAWAKGGKVMQPTMLTGEDGRDHPEFVIGTNPQFRKSNVAALQAAAATLGVKTARDSHKSKGPQKIKDSGRAVDKLPIVKRYAKLQGQEEDKNRQISIAESKVKEPDSLIKKVGTNADGEDIYEVDQGAVKAYTKQMQDVMKLWNDLIGKQGKGGIMNTLREVGQSALSGLSAYRRDRENNINQIKAAIKRDEKLLKSKNKGVRNKAQKRLEHNRSILGEQQQKRQDAGQKRGEIKTDLHDANFRTQEYQISKGDLASDIQAVSERAAKDAADANPTPPAPPTAAETHQAEIDTRTASLDAELALAQIGQGIGGKPPRSEQDILKDQAALQQQLINEANAMLKDNDKSNDLDAYNQLSSAASALQSIQGELAKFDPLKNKQALQAAVRDATTTYGNNFVRNATVATQASFAGQAAMLMGNPLWGGYRTPGIVPPSALQGVGQRPGATMGGTVVNLKPTFANVPPDPHTWSKAVAFEIQGAL